MATAPSTTIFNNQNNVLPLIYDPRHHTFESWASLMCEAFAANSLEIPGASTTWQGWAVGLKSIGLFSNEAVPDPYTFENWDDWATSLVNAFQPVTTS